jgi:hypothetical protein
LFIDSGARQNIMLLVKCLRRNYHATMTRLTDTELEALLNDLETDRVERKEAWAGDAPEKGCQGGALCQ